MNRVTETSEIEKLKREILMLRIRRECWDELVNERNALMSEVIRLNEKLAILHAIAEPGNQREWTPVEADYFGNEG